MPENFTTMTVGNYVFEFDFDTGELRLSWAGSQTFLSSDETEALGDFLFEVLSAQGHPPRILPLTITSVEVKTPEPNTPKPIQLRIIGEPTKPPEMVQVHIVEQPTDVSKPVEVRVTKGEGRHT
jgi:hypothetical protein